MNFPSWKLFIYECCMRVVLLNDQCVGFTVGRSVSRIRQKCDVLMHVFSTKGAGPLLRSPPCCIAVSLQQFITDFNACLEEEGKQKNI